MDMLTDGDETVTLSEILSLRDAYLNEEELWALCRECCLTLEYVRNSQDMFQTLCITPDTVAFDQTGNICFLDLEEDPEPLYLAPEYQNVGNLFTSHLFSLGMTMLYGVEYNLQTEEPKHELSTTLSDLLTNLCSDDYSQRPPLEDIIKTCDEVLGDKLSQYICSCIINTFIQDRPLEDDGTNSILDLSAGLASYLSSQSPHSPRQSTPQDLNKTTSITINDKQNNISHNTVIETDEYLLARLLEADNKQSSPFADSIAVNCDEELEKLGVEIVEINDISSKDKDVDIFANIQENCDRIKSQNCTSATPDSDKSKSRSQSMTYSGEMECLDLASILEITREKLDNLDLWALLREGITAIKKKRRHLPAFISPDTIVIKENGSIIFTTVPDGKKLETKYMAPELQQKGVLSEKTCLYGLAMSLQTINGNDDTDERLQDLLLSMLHTSADKRPTLAESLNECDQIQSLFDTTSRDGCQILLQRAWNYYSEDEEYSVNGQKESSLSESEVHNTSTESTSTHSSEPIRSYVTKITAPTPVSAFKPIHPVNVVNSVVIGSQSSAFKPIAVKPKTVPAKPVCGAGPSPSQLNDDGQLKVSSALTSKSCDSGREMDKGTQVIEKLKDLKKHILRHRPVEEVKCLETGVTSEVNNNEFQSYKMNELSESKTEDSLGKLLKKFDGQLPDTDTLATAIAQYLQTQMAGKSQKTKSVSPTGIVPDHRNVMSAQEKVISPLEQVSVDKPFESSPIQINSQSLQPQQTSNIQTFNMPIQQSSGQLASYPIQLQLQQDPKTGFVQLIPVGMVPYGTLMPQQSTEKQFHGKKEEMKDDTIPEDGSPLSFQQVHVEGKPPLHSRSAKYLVKKTAQTRTKNKSQGYMSDSGILEKSDFADDASFQFPSNNARKQIKNLQSELEQSFNSHTSVEGHNKYDRIFLSDSGNFIQSQNGNRSHHLSGSRSANASPSLSKDSGVSGLQPSFNSTNHDKSLMERLLSNDNLQHQKSLGHVLGILKESGFLEEARMDEFAVSEYITSLGNLRVDTFTSAVCEKYHQVDWDTDLLYSLYDAVNNSRQRNENKHQVTNNTSYSLYKDHHRISSPTYNQNSQISPKLHKSPSASDMSSPNSNQQSPPLLSSISGMPATQQESSSLLRQTSGVSETSDSTDTERREKRRKFKKRYQLDRSKSSSMNNLMSNVITTLPLEQHDATDIETGNGFKSRSMTTNSFSQSASFRNDNSKFSSPKNVNSNTPSPGSVSFTMERDYFSQSAGDYGVSSQEYVSESQNIVKSKNCELRNSIRRGWSQQQNNNIARTVSNNYQSNSSNDNIHMDHRRFQSSPSRNDSQFSRQHSKPLDSSRVNEYISDHVRNGSGHGYQPTHEKYYSADELSSASSSSLSKSKMSAVSQSTSTSQIKPNLQPLHSNTKDMVARRYHSKTSSDSEGSSNRSESVPLKARHDLGMSQNGRKITASRTTSTLSEIVCTSFKRKIQIIYHWAIIQHNTNSEVESFISQIDEENKVGIERQLSSIDQQLCMENKMRRKSQRFYQKLIDPSVKNGKGDQRGVTCQVLKDLEEMTKKVHILQLFKTHLQMLLAEFCGVHPSYSYSLALDVSNDALILQPYEENPLLHFQCMLDPHSNREIQVLQAGDHQALVAYLFISSAISNGFLHQFLFCYRYFITSDYLLDFIIHRYSAASRSNPADIRIYRIKQRALDILHYWVEGFYIIDFENNKTLLFRLEQFLMTQLSRNDENEDSITELLQLCSHGNVLSQSAPSVEDRDEEETTLYLKLDSPKKVKETLREWNSFKTLTKKNPAKRVQSFKDLTSLTKGSSCDVEDGFYPRVSKRNDTFSLLDFTPQSLVEQLTLIAQEIFLTSHPIQYLNSKADGVGVALSLPGLRTPSMLRKLDNSEPKSLFVGQWKPSRILDQLISMSQNISQWVAGEIVSCSNAKAQIQLLTKFISVAQICEEIRNYSTCVAVMEGLENLIVRQLPIWKNISSKYIASMESLSAMKMKLKSEPFYLIRDTNYMMYPTLPDTLYFLLHVQQMEMGNFRLANGLIKWTKIRTICQLIDQIRIFRSNEYGFEPNFDVQDNLMQRMEEFVCLDIQAVASQNDTNFRRMSTGGLQGVLRKMKGKLSM